MSAIRKEDALAYHVDGKPGKIEIVPTKPVSSLRDLSLAYSPGVAYPCLEIADDVEKVYDYTAKGNLVAVISNGTAVLGLGNIGPEASKPVMEGKSLLFKKYADIDSMDIELNVYSIDEFVATVKAMEPTFGGINLEDIKAPECFEIERQLKEALQIPIMHDDQHGTAIISCAALLNALELTGRKPETTKLLVSGAGAAAQSCVRLYMACGVLRENIVMADSKGVIRADRPDLDETKRLMATDRTDIREIPEAFVGMDVFVGLSKGNVVDEEMIKSMNANAIVFALANPDPEITWEKAHAARPDVMMATGRSDYPNQVNNVLGFPYIFRGALDVRATKINEEMKLAAVKAIAKLAKETVPDYISQIYGKKLSFGPDYLIPKPMDSRLLLQVSTAVAQAAIESGVARKPITDWDAYQHQLADRLGLNKGLTRVILERASRDPKVVLLPEAEHPRILKAAQIVFDENIATPMLLGNAEKIRAIAHEHEIDLPAGVKIFDPEAHPKQREEFAKLYFEKRQRKGITYVEALKRLENTNYYANMMLVTGQADALITGLTEKYSNAVHPAMELIGLEKDVKTCAGLYIMNTRKGVYFFADTTFNSDPDAETLVEIAVLTSRAVAFFNLTPVIAMLSYSNFGSNRDKLAHKMATATQLLHHRHPSLIVDGDIQANIALRPDLMQEFFPFSKLAATGANTFIFPNLAAANIAYKLVQELGEAEAIGPVLLGLEKPVHILQMGSSVREIVNMIGVAVVDAQAQNLYF
jgi:malate dehydrogenase (oxaloacetate-decarboxylating)(NADP+)